MNQIIRKDNVKLNIYCIKIKNNHTDKWMNRMNHRMKMKVSWIKLWMPIMNSWAKGWMTNKSKEDRMNKKINKWMNE